MPTSDPDRREVVADLSRIPSQLADIVNGAPTGVLDRRPPGGGWSAREIVARMADLEFNLRWSTWVARILQEPEPALTPVETDLRAVEHAYRNQDARVAVGAFTLARKHLVGVLGGLPEAAWSRRGRFPDGSAPTLAELARRFLAEDAADIARARELRATGTQP